MTGYDVLVSKAHCAHNFQKCMAWKNETVKVLKLLMFMKGKKQRKLYLMYCRYPR